MATNDNWLNETLQMTDAEIEAEAQNFVEVTQRLNEERKQYNFNTCTIPNPNNW